MIEFSTRCLACGKIEKGVANEKLSHDAYLDRLAAQGWCRRSFDTLAWHEGGWFCTAYCAYESEYALEEEGRQEERDERRFYRNTTEETLHGSSNAIAVITFLVFVIAFWLYASREYHHVVF